MSAPRIAILSLACRFAEADTPEALWRNVEEGRRSFRDIPPARLSLSEYDAALVGEADSIPVVPAGLISDWAFSRRAFHVPRATHAAADLTHWLALDIAAQAIASLGGPETLPRDRTAVILGDTLTGEFSRSAQLRLRLPYLTRRLDQVLGAQGIEGAARAAVLAQMAAAIRADFPDPGAETLAGALANTIAGRIANHFDLHGGAWTVDGACASSLLALNDACGRLAEGTLDAALVGGVDLSLDPFELVGFARVGALAGDEMRVFDRHPTGFWPGEGCGMAVLASEQGARRMGAPVLAWIEGWGVSTDGAGGLTRPTSAGQARALTRAWARAGQDPARAGLFEAHGTGTAIGDPTEIAALAGLIGQDGARVPVGSIKANIGHCKAAAGIAGLIKAAMALKAGVIPPHVGCHEPHPVFAETGHRLAPAAAADWRGDRRAGVSGFGFGGVNAHLVLAADTCEPARPRPPAPRPQEAELFLFAARSAAQMQQGLDQLAARAPSLSLAEMADAARACAAAADPAGRWRVAVVAARPADLVAALKAARDGLARTGPCPAEPPRLGLLFPGQAAPVRPGGGAWARRFDWARRLSDALPEGIVRDSPATEQAQPAILAASLMGAALLDRAGISGEVALGHSLGELGALAWAGCFDPQQAIALACQRGAVMARHARPGGSMALVTGDPARAADLARRHGLAVACHNGPRETVLAGAAGAIADLVAAAQAQPLRVSHAFHSPDMAPAVAPFAQILKGVAMAAPLRPVVSGVTGALLGPGTDLRALLCRQLTAPVRFDAGLGGLRDRADLLIDLGPGAGLSRLAQAAGFDCLSLDAGAATLRGLLETLAALWRRGVAVRAEVLFDDRPLRPLSQAVPDLLANPCGVGADDALPPAMPAPPPQQPKAEPVPVAAPGDSALSVVRSVLSEELGLPLEAIPAEARLLDDLHLNSLSVGRIVSGAAARLGLAVPAGATDVAGLSAERLALHLEELRDLGRGPAAPPARIEGVAPWLAEFETCWIGTALPAWPAAPVIWQPLATLPGAARAALAPVLAPETETETETGTRAGALILLDALPEGTEGARHLWRQIGAARKARVTRLAILHRGAALTGLARSLLAEGCFAAITLIDMAPAPEGWAAAARLLAQPQEGLCARRLGPGGTVAEPALRALPPPVAGQAIFGAQDLALVLGGARGIGAECALQLARRHGLALVLAGRSPAAHPEVARTLARAAAQGTPVAYHAVDVADPDALRGFLADLAATGRQPSLLIHAAGLNRPALFDDLDEDDLTRTLAPKGAALGIALAGLDPGRLRLVAGFGSIIGALGLKGESHYALANDMMSAELAAWGARTGVRVLALDWSVWAGAGMGERLGAVERLRAEGVDALPLGAAIERFLDLVADPGAGGRRIVTGRFGPPGDLRFAAAPLPALRFVETPQVHFPGVELVADAHLAPGADPWLEDHTVEGVPVVPGVLLLEAAAQVALALTGQTATGFAGVRFDRPVLGAAQGVTLRSAALVRDPGQVEVVLRASDDGFATDRARMIVQVGAAPAGDAPFEPVPPGMAQAAGPLYGPLFFNAGRFRRIETFEQSGARAVRVRIAPPAEQPWFGPYAPQDLVLGDAGARDGGLHALQACAPQRRLLPVAVGRIDLPDPAAPRVICEARERHSDGTRFVFDILWRDGTGQIVERWSAAEFRAIAVRDPSGLPDWLLPAVLEREAMLALGAGDLRLVLGAAADRAVRRRAVLAGLGTGQTQRRGDGALVTADGQVVALSHADGLTLGATGAAARAVDLVDATPSARLGPEDAAQARALATGVGWSETEATAALWAAREALRKAGAPLGAALVAEPGQGIARLRGGGLVVLCLRRAGGGAMALALGPGGPAVRFPPLPIPA